MIKNDHVLQALEINWTTTNRSMTKARLESFSGIYILIQNKFFSHLEHVQMHVRFPLP